MTLNTILKMRERITKVLIVGAVFFLIGYYTCILMKKVTVFSINNQVAIEINPFDILTTGITILLAFYVTRVLGKRNDLEKSEKEVLKLYLIEFKTLANEKIYRIIEQEDFDTPSTKSDLKILRKKISSILKLGEEFGYLEKNDALSTNLNNKVRDIWEFLTDCPEKVDARSSASVKKGVERLKIEQINKVEMALIEIERIVFQILMKINKK
jgi:hypothetical protein